MTPNNGTYSLSAQMRLRTETLRWKLDPYRRRPSSDDGIRDHRVISSFMFDEGFPSAKGVSEQVSQTNSICRDRETHLYFLSHRIESNNRNGSVRRFQHVGSGGRRPRHQRAPLGLPRFPREVPICNEERRGHCKEEPAGRLRDPALRCSPGRPLSPAGRRQGCRWHRKG